MAFTRTDRITGVAYLLALAAYRPDLLIDIERDAVGDDRMAAFMPLVLTIADPTLQPHYPARWPAWVTIETSSGEQIVRTVLDAPGDPGCPLGPEIIRSKFRSLTVGSCTDTIQQGLETAAMRSTIDDGMLADLLRECEPLLP